jgi:hypothetical protein
VVLAFAAFATLAFVACQQLSRPGADGTSAGGQDIPATSGVVTQTHKTFIPALGPAATEPVTTTEETAQSARAPEKAASCNDVIVNGSFDTTSGGRPWTGVANTPRTVYPPWFLTNARAHSGSQSGRVGSPSLNSVWDEMIQTVQLPGGVTGVTLVYWRFLDTAETSRTRAFDVFSVGLETEQGIQIVAPQIIDNTSDGRGQWVQSTLTLPNPGPYSDKRLWVTFKGRTDGNTPSTLYVDDVQLIVCATGW